MKNIRIILVNTSHSGNIGSVARAMKTMGLSELTLVDPLDYPNRKAIVMAAGADDILQNARIVSDLNEAIEDCDWVVGTSARSRSLEWPLLNPHECAEEIIAHPVRQTAIVFGREKSGLTNDELAKCHKHVKIPTDNNFSSLNLAQAVQVICYELRACFEATLEPNHTDELVELASASETEGFFEHLEQTLLDIRFLDPKHPKLLMNRLRRLFARTNLEKKEVNILRGILSAVAKQNE